MKKHKHKTGKPRQTIALSRTVVDLMKAEARKRELTLQKFTELTMGTLCNPINAVILDEIMGRAVSMLFHISIKEPHAKNQQ